ncbi:OmpW/AlkL family protein [Aquisalinus flavus]|uniref:Outer membrane protein OmpW n=1 Tax=Aquisalinus flavus TaxID=1526572 RepID=A0A8J2Y5B4_9PROT|nr:OmpW family outer membrane protein [Aquisalinus flavus]MBD0426782.1 OmpW family protein [Aquisalinus flavus]UNE46634.1 OmpW family protein [Aquisalinus flavus]GGC95942.1 outer membrane protein OmpW [Aquisalinus flavus]
MSLLRNVLTAGAATAAGLAFAAPAVAQTTDTPWADNNVLKLGVVHFSMNDETSELAGPNTPPGVTADVQSPTAATFTYTRHIGEHFGVELLAGIPFGVELNGSGSIEGVGQVAEATIATATLSGVYFFTPRSAQWRPYVSVGYNYTTFYDGEASAVLEGALSGQTDVSLTDSTGPGVYAGVNYAAGENWVLSAIIGYNEAQTDATLRTDTVVDLGAGPMNVGIIEREMEIDLNPVIAFLTVGYRF